VRGIGVADIINWCGLLPLRRNSSRCTTPKRCCSSTIASPRRAKSMLSWISACVPTTNCAVFAACCCFARLSVLPRPPANHSHLDAQRLQPGAQFQEMLLGKDLGRRHESRLKPRVDRLTNAARAATIGLAAADIALQQTLHRTRLFEIGRNLGGDTLLRPGQRKRE
jgi:hypothetical protein